MIVLYSDTAKHQLRDIWRFSRRRWGEARADRYVSALYEAVNQAAAGNREMTPRPRIHDGITIVRSGSHHIYLILEPARDVLHVVAILHQRMEPKRHIRKALKGEWK